MKATITKLQFERNLVTLETPLQTGFILALAIKPEYLFLFPFYIQFQYSFAGILLIIVIWFYWVYKPMSGSSNGKSRLITSEISSTDKVDHVTDLQSLKVATNTKGDQVLLNPKVMDTDTEG